MPGASPDLPSANQHSPVAHITCTLGADATGIARPGDIRRLLPGYAQASPRMATSLGGRPVSYVAPPSSCSNLRATHCNPLPACLTLVQTASRQPDTPKILVDQRGPLRLASPHRLLPTIPRTRTPLRPERSARADHQPTIVWPWTSPKRTVTSSPGLLGRPRLVCSPRR